MPSVSYADFASSLLHFSCIKLNYAVVGGCVGVSDNIPLSNFICSGSGIGSVLLAFVVIDYLHTVRWNPKPEQFCCTAVPMVSWHHDGKSDSLLRGSLHEAKRSECHCHSLLIRSSIEPSH